ncbi:hypothetical protein BAR24066_03990 [Burkholderia arboris]|uniref:Uncharacterized protein n=1 Tax=Burkholderia arboris TaxID=488730 RepID=A0A9Q9URT9_9BURK|nr:hypothetical protein BAR24066_03990 [Burkholderia arboris]
MCAWLRSYTCAMTTRQPGRAIGLSGIVRGNSLGNPTIVTEAVSGPDRQRATRHRNLPG